MLRPPRKESVAPLRAAPQARGPALRKRPAGAAGPLVSGATASATIKLLEDAPAGHAAHQRVRARCDPDPRTLFTFVRSAGRRSTFQVSALKVGGLERAQRVGRLCYMLYESGAGVQEMKQFRLQACREAHERRGWAEEAAAPGCGAAADPPTLDSLAKERPEPPEPPPTPQPPARPSGEEGAAGEARNTGGEARLAEERRAEEEARLAEKSRAAEKKRREDFFWISLQQHWRKEVPQVIQEVVEQIVEPIVVEVPQVIQEVVEQIVEPIVVDTHVPHRKEEIVRAPKIVPQEHASPQNVEVTAETPAVCSQELVHVPGVLQQPRHLRIDEQVSHQREGILHVPEVVPQERVRRQRAAAGRPRQARGRQLAGLPPDALAGVLAGLPQRDAFRAAAACAALSALARCPCWRRLDLRGVGVEASARGRRIMIPYHAYMEALEAFVRQPRFEKVEEVVAHTEIAEVLEVVARYCPHVRRLSLGDVRVASSRSRLQTDFERRLRAMWHSRPFVVHALGREYRLC